MADPLEFKLNQEEYEALVAYAREGAVNDQGQVNHEKAIRLEHFLQNIEKKNGVNRRLIWVQWQELDAPLPPNTRFPDVWPPELRVRIEHVTRDISRTDIDEVLAANAKNPTSVLFTKDAGAKYGWTPIEDYT